MTQHSRGFCTAAWVDAIIQLHDETVVATERVTISIPRSDNELVASRIHHMLQVLSYLLVASGSDTANVGLALSAAHVCLSKAVAVLVDDVVVAAIDVESMQHVGIGRHAFWRQLFVDNRCQIRYCLDLGQDFLKRCCNCICRRWWRRRRKRRVSYWRCRWSWCRCSGCRRRRRVLCGPGSSHSGSNRRCGRRSTSTSGRRDSWWRRACGLDNGCCSIYTWWWELVCRCRSRRRGRLYTRCCWDRLLVRECIRGGLLIQYTAANRSQQTLPQNPQMATFAFWHTWCCLG